MGLSVGADYGAAEGVGCQAGHRRRAGVRNLAWLYPAEVQEWQAQDPVWG